jgi:acetylornithine deacetylase/succinyl-diaminopimelate desuccinylase-like protein
MEEVGGLGTRSLVQDVTADFAILGESTGNLLALGHRGCVQVLFRVKGKSVHASVPSLGVNPHYVIARFLSRLENMPMRQSPIFGSSTVAPTVYRCDQSSGNVIPGECVLYLDWRNVPEEGKDDIIASLSGIANDSLIPGAQASFEVSESELTSYKGFRMRIPSTFPSYALPADHPLARESLQALRDLFGPGIHTRYWSFATDGGHLFEAGIPTIGYAVGDDRLAHTVQEHIEIDALVQSVAGNMAIAKRLGAMK